MKLQNQVCNLEQAKKLSELGIVQGKSIFFYDTWMSDKNKLQYNSGHQNGDGYKNPESCFSAFTLSELGTMLDSETYTQRTGSEDSKYANWEWMNDGNETGSGLFATEVEARCEMLITALTNGTQSVETCNSRLVE